MRPRFFPRICLSGSVARTIREGARDIFNLRDARALAAYVIFRSPSFTTNFAPVRTKKERGRSGELFHEALEIRFSLVFVFLEGFLIVTLCWLAWCLFFF